MLNGIIRGFFQSLIALYGDFTNPSQVECFHTGSNVKNGDSTRRHYEVVNNSFPSIICYIGFGICQERS